MNSKQAKLILQAYTASQPENPDEQAVREAFAMLEKDSELQTWFAEEQAFDQAMRHKLSSIEPPAALQKQILKRMEETVPQETSNLPEPTRPTAHLKWFLPLAAAGFLILLTVIVTFSGERRVDAISGESGTPPFLAYLKTEYVDPGFQLERVGGQLPELRAYLAENNSPYPREATTESYNLSPIGCMRINYRDVTLGLICFKDGNTVFHLISANKSDFFSLFPNLTPEKLPAVFESGETSFKVWSDSQNLNILTHYGSNRNIDRFF